MPLPVNLSKLLLKWFDKLFIVVTLEYTLDLLALMDKFVCSQNYGNKKWSVTSVYKIVVLNWNSTMQFAVIWSIVGWDSCCGMSFACFSFVKDSGENILILKYTSWNQKYCPLPKLHYAHVPNHRWTQWRYFFLKSEHIFQFSKKVTQDLTPPPTTSLCTFGHTQPEHCTTKSLNNEIS